MKKNSWFVVLSFTAVLAAGNAGARPPNYDESKIGPYKLEDPLTFANGKKLASPQEWQARRKEILEIFQSQMYGRMPPPPTNLTLEVFEQGETLHGFGIRKQVRMWFRPDKTGPKIDWLVLLPRYAKAPVPAILWLNYCGNQELVPDRQVPVTDAWLFNGLIPLITDHHTNEKSRGVLAHPDDAGYKPSDDAVFPAGMILARGYAVATACYGEVSPDPVGAEEQDKLAYTGVFSLWPPRDPKRDDNTTSLAAWGWALMRGLDMLEREPAVDAKKVVVTGYSRLGKAALLAGAFDERFPVVIPNQTGGGGCPLAKRDFGENVSTEMKAFTHWYCKAYNKYVDNEAAMPFDQHLLLACIAPRRLLVQGFDSKWFDTKGEFLSCQAAAPVWKFLGLPTLPEVPFPDDMEMTAIGSYLGYYHRPGAHGINYVDWTQILSFADQAFQGK